MRLDLVMGLMLLHHANTASSPALVVPKQPIRRYWEKTLGMTTKKLIPNDEDGDPGEPLMLTPFIKAKRIKEGREAARVDSKYTLDDMKSYAGYITVDEQNEVHLWFWYFPVETAVSETPCILWMQGVPGTSSLYGLFNEVGPFWYGHSKGFPQLKEMKYSWRRNHSLLFIDHPVGTGYSFSKSYDSYATNQSTVGVHLYEALSQIIRLFPHLQDVPLTIVGEGSAGKSAVHLGKRIVTKRKERGYSNVNFYGVVIGNGFIDPLSALRYHDMARVSGIVSPVVVQKIKEFDRYVVELIRARNYVKAYENYNYLIEEFLTENKINNLLNYVNESSRPDVSFLEYMNNPDVRRALHAGDTEFKILGMAFTKMTGEFMTSSLRVLEELVEEVPIMLYSGQVDAIVPYVGSANTNNWINFSGSDKFQNSLRKPWYHNQKTVGYYRAAGNLLEVMIRDAGHMAALDAPDALLGLISAFTRNLSLEKDTGYLTPDKKRLRINILLTLKGIKEKEAEFRKANQEKELSDTAGSVHQVASAGLHSPSHISPSDEETIHHQIHQPSTGLNNPLHNIPPYKEPVHLAVSNGRDLPFHNSPNGGETVHHKSSNELRLPLANVSASIGSTADLLSHLHGHGHHGLLGGLGSPLYVPSSQQFLSQYPPQTVNLSRIILDQNCSHSIMSMNFERKIEGLFDRKLKDIKSDLLKLVKSNFLMETSNDMQTLKMEVLDSMQTLYTNQERLKKEIESINYDINELKLEQRRLQSEIENLQFTINSTLAQRNERRIELDDDTERKLVLFGIEETGYDKLENKTILLNKVYAAFKQILNINIQGYVTDIRRFGDSGCRKRPLVIVLSCKNLTKHILQNRKRFKNTGFAVSEYLAPASLKYRRKLAEVLFQAGESKSDKLFYTDKLFINNQIINNDTTQCRFNTYEVTDSMVENPDSTLVTTKSFYDYFENEILKQGLHTSTTDKPPTSTYRNHIFSSLVFANKLAPKTSEAAIPVTRDPWSSIMEKNRKIQKSTEKRIQIVIPSVRQITIPNIPVPDKMPIIPMSIFT